MAARKQKGTLTEADLPVNGGGKSRNNVAKGPSEPLFHESEALTLDTTDPHKAPKVTAEPEFISPQQAQEWLDTFAYDKQRERYGPHVKDIAYALAHKQYSIQGVILCEIDGVWRLTNGQHRLQAIVDSGIGTWEIVIRKHGLTSAVGAKEYSRTDRGKRRQTADALRAQIAPEEFGLNSNQVNLVGGAVTLIAPGFGYTKPTIRTRLQLNNQDVRVMEVTKWLKPAGLYFKTVKDYHRGRYKHLALAATVAVGLVTCEYAWDRAEEFWFRAAQDSPKDTDDWLKVLLIDVFEEKRTERAKPPLFARYVAQVWNRYYEGKPVTRVNAPDMKEPITILGTPYKGRHTSSLINPQIEA